MSVHDRFVSGAISGANPGFLFWIGGSNLLRVGFDLINLLIVLKIPHENEITPRTPSGSGTAYFFHTCVYLIGTICRKREMENLAFLSTSINYVI